MILSGHGAATWCSSPRVCVLIGVVLWFVADLVEVTLDSTDMPIASAPTPDGRTDRRVMRLRSGLAYDT